MNVIELSFVRAGAEDAMNAAATLSAVKSTATLS
jgi:hypothetical protein